MIQGNSKGGFNTLYNTYRFMAKKRNLEFQLTKEEFAELTKENYWYCGRPPSQIRKNHKARDYYLYNGIDRVDNSKGYVSNNCTPCCGMCNKMKNAYSGEDFIN